MRFPRVAVVGVGLIGGSFALALKAAGACSHVVGIGRGAGNLELAKILEPLPNIPTLNPTFSPMAVQMVKVSSRHSIRMRSLRISCMYRHITYRLKALNKLSLNMLLNFN